MIEEECDLWDRAKHSDVDLLICTTNNVIKNNGALVMGAGVAAQFCNYFKYVEFAWGKQISKLDPDYGFLLDGPRNWGNNSIYLGALQTKRNWRDPSDIDLIVRSSKKMKAAVDLFGFQKVIMSRPGCGNGQLTWAKVRSKLKFLDDRFVVVSKEDPYE